MIVIDHNRIPDGHLSIAKSNAARSPDGEIYPWRDLYPLIGQTVYYDGELWTLAAKERGPGAGLPTSIVRLVGWGRDGSAATTLGELRPVTWTQADETVEFCNAGRNAALASGDIPLAHRYTAALNGDRAELSALQAGLPSPHPADGPQPRRLLL